MQIKQLHLGMRTIKTALAVMCCIAIFHLAGRGSPMISAVSAVFAMRQDLTTTVEFGKSRVIGNTLGGVVALFYFVVQDYFGHQFLIELLLIPFLVIVVIVISNFLHNEVGIISCVAALLLIVFNVPKGESVLYAAARVFDTFIGIFVAIGVNALVKPPKKAEIEEVDEDINLLEQKEAELEALRAQLEAYVEADEQKSQAKKEQTKRK